MNIQTREIQSADDLTDEQRASGQWVPVAKKWAKKYEQKQPVSDADYARIMAAERRRIRRAMRRLDGAQ